MANGIPVILKNNNGIPVIVKNPEALAGDTITSISATIQGLDIKLDIYTDKNPTGFETVLHDVINDMTLNDINTMTLASDILTISMTNGTTKTVNLSDYVSSSELTSALSTKENVGTCYTKLEEETLLNNKVNVADFKKSHMTPEQILVTNSGAVQGQIDSYMTVTVNLASPNYTFSVDSLASATGATVADVVNQSTSRILETPTDKSVNEFRFIFEFTHQGGSADGTIDVSLENPSTGFIVSDERTVNIDGNAGTYRKSFFLRTVKTSNNNTGYQLKIKNGARQITTYKLISILRS